MMFRLTGTHTHQTEVGGEVFTCLRKDIPRESGFDITWWVYRGDVLLKNDCRTLNEAKRLCRSCIAPPNPA